MPSGRPLRRPAFAAEQRRRAGRDGAMPMSAPSTYELLVRFIVLISCMGSPAFHNSTQWKCEKYTYYPHIVHPLAAANELVIFLPSPVAHSGQTQQEERTVDEDSGCAPPKRGTRNDGPMPRRNQLYRCSLHAVLPTSRCCSV